jgi:osmoprotectant transport system permease protein
VVAVLARSAAAAGPAAPLVVGSKNFEESRLLAEIFAQSIEARTGLAVERRLGLAGTQVCFAALRTGAIDLYPEYTGTGLVTILGAEPGGGPAATLAAVRREFLARWDLWWLAPLGFENAFELAVPRRFAAEHGLATISDLAGWSRARPGRLRAAFGHEFVGREDGLPGLERAYGLAPGDVRPLQHALKYRAAAAGEADVIDAYTTDGRLLTHDLVVLDDDRGFFPPYQAAPLMRGAAARAHPEAVAALALLAGALDEAAMRRLNLRLQEGREEEGAVAADALRALGLVEADGAGEAAGVGRAAAGAETRTDAGTEAGAAGASVGGARPSVAATGAAAPGREGLLRYAWSRRSTLGRRTLEHLGLSAAALALGAVLAVPLGLALERRRRAAEAVIRAVALTQTVPSLALLAFMIPLLGVGPLPAMVALWIYSLFPILRNTYTGVRDADPEAVAAALALGMTPAQVLARIRLPLAAPVVMAGVRTAAVLTVGTATLAAFIGAGGLGEPIVTGLQLADTRMILSGAVPAALLALAVDAVLGGVERLLRPAGL